jgi:hypothetical protein
MKVDILGLDGQANDKKYGTIYLENNQFRCDPEDSAALQNILKTPVTDYQKKKKITAQDDPEAFMKNLCLQYRNCYLYASKPE